MPIHLGRRWGVAPGGGRDLSAFFLEIQGRQNLTESMISAQPRAQDAAHLWLLVLALVEIAWVGAISLTLYWLLTS
jgi:hypothetical protein